MRKINTKVQKFVSLTTIFALVFVVAAGVFSGSTAHAAKFVDGTWTQSAAPGITTITFTNTGALVAGDTIVLTFPSEATVNNTATVSGGTNTVTGQTTPTFSVTGQVLTITLDAAIAGSTAITISMTDALSAYTTTTFAQQSVAVNTNSTLLSPIDFGVAIITNDNTTDVTATVPLFVTLAVNDVTMDLGTLSASAVNTVTQQYTANSNNTSGVTLQIDADAVLNNATDSIADVSDGTVTAGSEEYGISVSTAGLTLQAPFNAGHDAVPVAATTIATSANEISSATLDVTYRASISGTTVAGSYNQVVTMTIATNA